MKLTNKIIIFIALICSFTFAQSVTSDSNRKFLNKDVVGTDVVKSVLRSDFQVLSKTSENLEVTDGKWKVMLTLDTDRSLVKFSSRFEASDNLSAQRAYKLVNQFAKGKIMTIPYYSVENDGSWFYLDYYMVYDGGIMTENLNSAIEWYFKLCSDMSSMLTEEDAMK